MNMPNASTFQAVLKTVTRYEESDGQPQAISIAYQVQGTGPLIVMLPSLGRDVEDFELVSTLLADAGYRVACPSPRGIGASTGPLDKLTLHDFARDIVSVIEAEGGKPAFIAGHAFGNWTARMVAVDRPDLVLAVLILAAGPRVVAKGPGAGLPHCMDKSLDEAVRLDWIKKVFFAEASDASVWLDGWHPAVADAQRAAKAATPVEHWWGAGNASILDVRALEDAFAPQEAGWQLSQDLGTQRVTTVSIANAGHALLPEQPLAVAEAMKAYLRDFQN
ncbi:alpha/beta fold hydrolase [Advenella mimigardefordensis]|uniref:Alpha/beta hydrolase fold domain-containing protein n=1 Tax=Advenella mimigardefordensis (strain DSM 17166 / LMG 22922 / DPN7) TaxID=1247726 RepID=W0PI57_ADVMD|nr:alpha/beta hydrolase [Advenella mimigardefordensis]AHG64613.1 alpha/beta hydrolase fold domain-containing protein [Advenella mimigardefordensis DPN7]